MEDKIVRTIECVCCGTIMMAPSRECPNCRLAILTPKQIDHYLKEVKTNVNNYRSG